jgi:hypothetical protein
MSYDITLQIDTGNGKIDVVDCGNYTYNCAPMLTKAANISLLDLRGAQCKEVVPILSAAIDTMTIDPKVYKALEPENGWGDYEGWLRYLRTVRDACQDHPLCTLHVG